MQVDITNFRCWEKKAITFPTKGLCLLNGKSGKGKSSILNSILYAITGKGKNISTFSKKHTKVSISIDNLTITRSRGPNRLLVHKKTDTGDKTYEDDEAQHMIDSIFGSEFSNTSYIDQDNLNSFVFLSPSEKMEFLENLLLSQYDIDRMKNNIKDNISSTKTDYTSYESKINTLEDLIKGMTYIDQPLLKVEKLTITQENYGKTSDKLRHNLDISEKNLKVISLKIKKLEEEQKNYTEIYTKQKIAEHTKIQLERKLQSYDILVLNKEISEIEHKKQTYILNKERGNLRKSLQDLTDKFEESLLKNQQEMEELNSKLPSIVPDKKYIESLYIANDLLDKILLLDEKLIHDIDYENEVKEERTKLEDYSSKLSSQQQALSNLEKCYKCPSCSNLLKIQNQTLVVFNTDSLDILDTTAIKENIKELKLKIEISTKKISSLIKDQTLYEKYTKEYNAHFDRLEILSSTYEIENDKDWIDTKLKELEISLHVYEDTLQKIKNIKNDRYTSELEKQIDKINIKLSTFDEKSEDISEEEYLKMIEVLARNKEHESSALKIKKEYDETVSSLKDMVLDNKNYEDLIQEEQQKKNTYEEKIKMYRKNISDLDQWFDIYSKNTKYNEIKHSIEITTLKKNECNDRMRCLVKLREHVKNAERKSITDFIESLNDHASLYIEEFFPDEDIIVSLKTIQETKTDKREKISLNFEVQYKKMNGDLSFLSGGEKDRVNLAFTLAFAELVDNRILLLDECISSLDTETTNVVLENLKEKYKGNLIILVSHQANLGFFDQVIDL